MRKILLAAIAASAALAAPAAAVTYDIADFGGPFSYAQYNGGTSFTAFANPCSFGSACVAGPEGAGNSQVVYDAGASLVAHPGVSGTTAVIFTAPTSRNYTVNGTATLFDGNGVGDGVTLTGYLNGTLFPAGTLTQPVGGASATQSFSGSVFLTSGQQIALIVGNNGGNFYDSVNLTGTITAVPEPATWAMMIGGVGVGAGAMRRRRNQARAALA